MRQPCLYQAIQWPQLFVQRPGTQGNAFHPQAVDLQHGLIKPSMDTACSMSLSPLPSTLSRSLVKG